MRSLFVAALCSVVVSTAAFAGATPDGGPRIRPQDVRIKEALREGAARSTTFRSLLDRIDTGDVIVYVAVNPLIKSNLSGALTWMTSAGGFRYVRASISPDQNLDQMIATVAHELQHALEVVNDPTVTSEGTLVAMYRHIGQQNNSASPNRWETVAAQETGYQVRRELGATPAALVMARASGAQNDL